MDTITVLRDRHSAYFDRLGGTIADCATFVVSKTPGAQNIIDWSLPWIHESLRASNVVFAIFLIAGASSLYVKNGWSSAGIFDQYPLLRYLPAAVSISASASCMLSISGIFRNDAAGSEEYVEAALHVLITLGTGLLYTAAGEGVLRTYEGFLRLCFLEAVILCGILDFIACLVEFYWNASAQPVSRHQSTVPTVGTTEVQPVSDANIQEQPQDTSVQDETERFARLEESLESARTGGLLLQSQEQKIQEDRKAISWLTDTKALVAADLKAARKTMSRLQPVEQRQAIMQGELCIHSERNRVLVAQANNNLQERNCLTQRLEERSNQIEFLQRQIYRRDFSLRGCRSYEEEAEKHISELRNQIQVHIKDNELLLTKRKAAEYALKFQAKAFEQLAAKCRFAETALQTKFQAVDAFEARVAAVAEKQEMLEDMIDWERSTSVDDGHVDREDAVHCDVEDEHEDEALEGSSAGWSCTSHLESVPELVSVEEMDRDEYDFVETSPDFEHIEFAHGAVEVAK